MNGLDCRYCMDSQKEVRGCEGFKKEKDFRIFENEIVKISRCPVKEIEMDAKLYMEAYHFYKQGFLTTGGAWTDAPNKLIEVIMFLDSFIADLQQKEEKKNKPK